jgi:hypothetical protein
MQFYFTGKASKQSGTFPISSNILLLGIIPGSVKLQSIKNAHDVKKKSKVQIFNEP